jgi:hypothetical protein
MALFVLRRMSAKCSGFHSILVPVTGAAMLVQYARLGPQHHRSLLASRLEQYASISLPTPNNYSKEHGMACAAAP